MILRFLSVSVPLWLIVLSCRQPIYGKEDGVNHRDTEALRRKDEKLFLNLNTWIKINSFHRNLPDFLQFSRCLCVSVVNHLLLKSAMKSKGTP